MSESRHAEGVRLDSLQRSADAATHRRARAATREANAQERRASAEERIATALERLADHICGTPDSGAAEENT